MLCFFNTSVYECACLQKKPNKTNPTQTKPKQKLKLKAKENTAVGKLSLWKTWNLVSSQNTYTCNKIIPCFLAASSHPMASSENIFFFYIFYHFGLLEVNHTSRGCMLLKIKFFKFQLLWTLISSHNFVPPFKFLVLGKLCLILQYFSYYYFFVISSALLSQTAAPT